MNKVKHDGLHSNRLSCPHNKTEKVFAVNWKYMNSSSVPLLGNLLSSGDGRELLPLDDNNAQVAATVVQWLGSTVGLEFLRTTLSGCGYEMRKL